MDTLANRNNNPGNLKDPKTGTFRQFSSPQEGYGALLNDLQAKKTGTTTTGVGPSSTLADFAKVYAPESDNNNPAQYTANIANYMKVRPDATLDSLDVGKWAEAVANAEGYKSSQPIQQTNQQVTSQPAQQSTEEEPKGEGIVKSLARGITQPVATMLARPVQLGARLLGKTEEEVNQASAKVPFFGEGGRLDVPQTGADVIKDIGRGAQTVALGMPVGTLGGAVKMGTVSGAGAGLEETGTAEGTVKGGLIGSVTGLAGGGISKVLEMMPKSLVSSAFKGLTPDKVEQALATKTIGTAQSILNQSKTSLQTLGKQLGNELKSPTVKDILLTEQDIFQRLAKNPTLIKALEDKGLTLPQLSKKLSTVSGKGGLVDKLFTEGLNLTDLNRLKTALGKNTYVSKLVEGLLKPEQKSGKEIANIFYNGIKETIQEVNPNTIPLFNELAKENAIKQAVTKASKQSGSLIRWRDIVPFMIGSSAGGPAAGIGTVGLIRGAENPAIQFGLAKGLQTASKGITPVTSRAGLIPSATNQ